MAERGREREREREGLKGKGQGSANYGKRLGGRERGADRVWL